MPYAISIALMLSVTTLFFVPPAAGADNSKASVTAAAVVYKPPMRGAPASRIGGGTRGTGKEGFVLSVLAPDHTGLTSQAQPTLYWYASGPSTTTLEVTVIAEVAERPVITKNLNLTRGGVQSFDLAKHGITLKPDTEYEWFISAVPDPAQRSKDVTSGGTIRRVSSNPAVQARVAAANEREAPMIYAEAGLWYDAIDALSRLIERYPDDSELKAQRAALLNQVGLPTIASSDKVGIR